MHDAPVLTRRRLVRSLVCSLLVGVGFTVIGGVTGGVVGFIAHGVAVLGGSSALSAAGELYRLRHPSKYGGRSAEGPGRVFASGILAAFFAAAGSFIYFAMTDPGSGCVDCDTAEAHAVAAAILMTSWGAAGFLVWRMVRSLREQRASRQ